MDLAFRSTSGALWSALHIFKCRYRVYIYIYLYYIYDVTRYMVLMQGCKVSPPEPLGGCPLGPQTGAGVVPSRSKLSFTISSYVQRVGQSKVVGTAVGKVWTKVIYIINYIFFLAESCALC